MEKCNIDGTEVDLPVDLIENSDIFSSVLSLNTWNNILTPEQRNKLKNYLPVLPTDYPHAQLENLRALFEGANFKFGNPVETFKRKLQGGHYAADITRFRRQCKAAKQKEYKLRLKKFYRKLVHDVLISRQEIIDKVLPSSHQDTTITLSWHERQLRKSSSFSGNLENKYKKIMKEIKDECEDQCISSDEEPPDCASAATSALTSTANHNTVTEEDYHKMLCIHKRKRLHKENYPELDTRTITVEDVISRTNVTMKKVLKTGVKRKMKGKDKKEQFRKLKKKRVTSTHLPDRHGASSSKSVNMVVEPVATTTIKTEENANKSCKYLESSSACFFSVLRDVFLELPDATADLRQLERMVEEWQASPGFHASSWSFETPNWINLILSALKYLGGSSKKAVTNNASFSPLVIFKQKVHQWKWIGTCRDSDGDLLPLCEHWFETKDQVSIEPATSTAPASALNSSHTDYVVGPSTSDEKIAYQNQERDRYENPHKPFVYQMHGFESIVAPVKGVYTKESNLNKAREHSLLVSKRPPYVTILTLVRDAAARLPNGEGTRAEVCQLLKDSQYINPDATDGQIHTVVSGALDRLHYEKDPCVKYDNTRKVWIYLHKTRSVHEFERIHEASAAAARAKKQMSQKQKQLKQQQKGKDSTMSVLNPSLSAPAVGEGDHADSAAAMTSGSLVLETAKQKKTKKRAAVSPKKNEKSKVKVKKERLDVIPPEPVDRPQQLPVVSDLGPAPVFNPFHDSTALDYRDHREHQDVFLSPATSPFGGTSRLNSPYMDIGQSDESSQESMSFGKDRMNVKIEPGFENADARVRSYSSSSSIESESDSESSSEDDRRTNQQLMMTSGQEPSMHFGEQRLPFNNVLSLGQANPNAPDNNSAYSGYY